MAVRSYKDLFIVDVVVTIGFAKMKLAFPPIAGLLAFIEPVLAYFAKKYFGFLIGAGVMLIDLTLDTRDEASKRVEWKRSIDLIWEKTSAKVYDEKEKADIRAQYLAALRKYVPVGIGPSAPSEMF